MKALARGCNPITKRVKAFIINGYRFHSLDHGIQRKNQNFGIMVEADGETCYGRQIDIHKLDYYSHCKVVIFVVNGWILIPTED